MTAVRALATYAELPDVLRDAVREARDKTQLLMLLEVEKGLYRIVPGTHPWTPQTRVYITSNGDIVVSDMAARRFGFVLPALAS
jgi:hypothetical protein